MNSDHLPSPTLQQFNRFLTSEKYKGAYQGPIYIGQDQTGLTNLLYSHQQ